VAYVVYHSPTRITSLQHQKEYTEQWGPGYRRQAASA